jgi:hypothetical protein
MNEIPSLAEIERELLDMVDAGELHMGWSDERQEFVFWHAGGAA